MSKLRNVSKALMVASLVLILTFSLGVDTEASPNGEIFIAITDTTTVPGNDWPTGWVHVSRDGSPPPWERNNGHQIVNQVQDALAFPQVNAVRIDRIPLFRNDNIRFEETNGMIANVGRQFVRQSMSRPTGIGMESADTLSVLEQQLSNQLMRDIMLVFAQDPLHQIFTVNPDGMMLQLDATRVATYSARQGEPTGRFGTFDGFLHASFAIDIEGVGRSEDEILHTLFYELLKREHGAPQANLIAELVMGINDEAAMRYAFDWLRFTGVHRAIGVGNVFAATQESEAGYIAKMNERLREIAISVDYQTIMQAMGGAGNAIRIPESLEILARDLGIPQEQVRSYLIDVMNNLTTIKNLSLSENVRNRAAQEFSVAILNIAQISYRRNLGYWNVDRSGALISFRDYYYGIVSYGVVIDLNSPELGVFLMSAGRPNPHGEEVSGSIFPEVPDLLQSIAQQQMASTDVQPHAGTATESTTPHSYGELTLWAGMPGRQVGNELIIQPFMWYYSYPGLRAAMVTPRVFADVFGLNVDWNDETRTFTIAGGDVTVVATLCSTIAIVNGEAVDIATFVNFGSGPAGSVRPVIAYDRSFLPVRFFANAFGLDVSVSIDGEIVTIN